MANVYVATSTFYCHVDGKRVMVREGDTASEGHPVLADQPSRFKLLNVRFGGSPAAPVEQATAAPGEQREVKRGPGRPKLPRDEDGNIVRPESGDEAE